MRGGREGLLYHNASILILVSSSLHPQVSLVVSTVDCRKQPLVFKASIYELRHDLLLVEFRRSKVSHDWGQR